MAIFSGKCSICGNNDQRTFGIKNGIPYCRKCIGFQGVSAPNLQNYPKNARISLSYSLSFDQQDLSDRLLDNYKSGIDSLVSAVCGAGKTEIVLAVISYAVRCGDRVGFAIPRRDVVREIAERLQNIFKGNIVTSVYGGHNSILDGDIVCLTTHQLFRYEKYFDLLIMDEIDAFPYKGSFVLESFFSRSIKGHFILMSATASADFIRSFKEKGNDVLYLDSRFHHHPLPVPSLSIYPAPIIYFSLVNSLEKFIKNKLPVFIFCPTIEDCENLYTFLRIIFKNGDFVHSKRKKRDKIIYDFKKGDLRYLVTTSILERGVTVKNLQVIVFRANHMIFDSPSLVQIAGRAGRKADAPEGKVIYFADEITPAMRNSIKEINRANKNLQDMLQAHQEQLSICDSS